MMAAARKGSGISSAVPSMSAVTVWVAAVVISISRWPLLPFSSAGLISLPSSL